MFTIWHNDYFGDELSSQHKVGLVCQLASRFCRRANSTTLLLFNAPHVSQTQEYVTRTQKIFHKCIKTAVVLSAWRWWLCDESDSPTQVALCSNLSLLPLTPQTPGNPPAPPPPSPPLNPEMLDNPPLFIFTFQPPNYPHLFARNDCSRKPSWAVTLVLSRTVRAGWLRPTVRHRRLGVYSAAQEASRRASHTASRGASLRNTRWCSCRRAAVLREFPAPVWADLGRSKNIIGNKSNQ